MNEMVKVPFVILRKMARYDRTARKLLKNHLANKQKTKETEKDETVKKKVVKKKTGK